MDLANGLESTSGEPLELRRAEQTRIVSRDRLCTSNSVVNFLSLFCCIMDFYPSWKALFGKLAQDLQKLTDFNGYVHLLKHGATASECKLELSMRLIVHCWSLALAKRSRLSTILTMM
jgi:hypothetical protein